VRFQWLAKPEGATPDFARILEVLLSHDVQPNGSRAVLQPRPPRASEAAGRAVLGRDVPVWLVVVGEFVLILPTMQPDRAAVGTSALLGCTRCSRHFSRRRPKSLAPWTKARMRTSVGVSSYMSL
jgi:hypothetical protein